MKLFFSAGEPSGDVHAASLIRELRRQSPSLQVAGFGGPHMEAAGAGPLLFPLAQYPVMGFVPAAAGIGRYLKLASMADRHFRHERPDGVVLVDYPGFNWWVARRARFHGIPVFYFLPPQIWGWATWRVRKMGRLVDHVMCSLPFEAPWYARHGVSATYTGHPYFDELHAQRIDQQFIAEHTSAAEGPVIGILPGSRTREVRRIFPAYLRVAERIARTFPKARFLVACLRPEHRKVVLEHLSRTHMDVRPYVERTAEIIQTSKVCLAKSGSVSLELLYHTKPSTILYQVGWHEYQLYHMGRSAGLIPAPYITLVNLMAGREILPEYVARTDVSERLSRHALDWLQSPEAYGRTVAELARLKAQVATPGATASTAAYILQHLGFQTSTRRAA